MTTDQLRRATAEFDVEHAGETFAEPSAAQQSQLQRAKRKRGRPKIGQGVRVISVSIERALLQKADRLARRLKVKRARLIARGLQAVVSQEVSID
jgi:hypothetical protein